MEALVTKKYSLTSFLVSVVIQRPSSSLFLSLSFSHHCSSFFSFSLSMTLFLSFSSMYICVPIQSAYLRRHLASCLPQIMRARFSYFSYLIVVVSSSKIFKREEKKYLLCSIPSILHIHLLFIYFFLSSIILFRVLRLDLQFVIEYFSFIRFVSTFYYPSRK